MNLDGISNVGDRTNEGQAVGVYGTGSLAGIGQGDQGWFLQ